MTKIIGGVNIPGPILPYDSNDTYYTHEDLYGLGGWKSVETVKELESIPRERLKNGCIVRIVSANGGEGLEFYYDDTIKSEDNPFSYDPEYPEDGESLEYTAWNCGFRKWIPGYLPTKVSELENDEHYVKEVTDEDGIPIDPNLSENVGLINQILFDRDEENEGHRGLYNDLGKAFLHKNEYNDSEGEPIYGLVTVNEDGKISPTLLEGSLAYVVMLEGFFPDDVENGLLIDGTAGNTAQVVDGGSHPSGMSKDFMYFVTGNYEGRDPESFKYMITTANDTETWTATVPSKNCIYVNKARNEAYICEDTGTDLVCIGRGGIVNNLGDFGVELDKETERAHWEEIPLSAEMGYWLKEQIEMVYDCVIGQVNSRLDQEIEDRRNADDVIRNYTVNSIPISQNPVLTGGNVNVTGYSKGTSGAISSGDTINTALSKLETQIDNLSESGGSAGESISTHLSDYNNPHKVTRDQLGLGEGAEVTFSKLTAPNGFFQSSDSRLKEDVERINTAGKRIRLVQFRWKDTGKIGFGVIADEVEKLYPSIVEVDKNNYKTVNYTEALIIKLAQLENELEEVKKELENLKNNGKQGNS